MSYMILIVYSLVGLIIILSTSARQEVVDTLRDLLSASAPTWKIIIAMTIICTGILLFWPFFLPGLLRKRKSAWDVLQENPAFQQQKDLFDAMSTMCEDGCEMDEIPEGYGDFGYDITNPIPTKTVFGSTSYLARLRSHDGAKVIYNRQGSLSSPVSSHPIDGYTISHPDGKELAILYLSPYHKRNSEKVPEGFTLL